MSGNTSFWGNKMKTDIKKNDSFKPKYAQRFCDKWLTVFYPWLARCEDDPYKPFCKACQCRLDPNRCHLQRHERTTKHARNLEILITKGEGVARKNFCIRQERSKYYQQRKGLNLSFDDSNTDMERNDDYFEATEEDCDNYQLLHGDDNELATFNNNTTIKKDSNLEKMQAVRSNAINISEERESKVIRTERNKLLLQIQKEKNELMDSFKVLVGQPQKEKNHVDLFFESVSSTVKTLPPILIAEAKMRVSQLICELEIRTHSESDPVITRSCNNSNSAIDTNNSFSVAEANVTILEDSQKDDEPYQIS